MRYSLGLELDALMKEHLQTLSGGLRDEYPAVIWLAPEQLFVTLLFLGDPRSLGKVKRLLLETATRLAPFEFILGRSGCFPSSDPVRTIWVGISDRTPMLSRLIQDSSRELAKVGLLEPAEREFVPHVVLGRIPGKNPKGGLRKKVEALKVTPMQVLVKEVCLIQSKLTNDGAAYSVVFRAPLTAQVLT